MKNYTTAPLPFQGQKRRFLKDFKEALNGFSPTATYVDLFGGSGLLSHTVKQHYPNASVVWNDFDNYSERLGNIEKTNVLLKDFRVILANCEDGKKIPNEVKNQIIERVKQENKVDYITISSSLLFSMKYVTSFEELEKETMYNNIKQSDYNADNYLQGVERVQSDYRLLFEQYKNHNNVVFLVDPPYLSTDVSSYSKEVYWKLSDYLNVLKCLQDANYFYFTSEKSQILELCDWMETSGLAVSPFRDSTMKIVNVTMNHTAKYKDIMLYKNE